MKNRWLESKLRRLESSIESLENPQTCGATFDGSQRTISPDIKVRELENLITKLAECQQLVQTDNEQEWVNSVGQTLKEKVNLVFNNSQVSINA